ncbi:MAG: FtsX-like permease family protein [Lachnospiraceae bacterium]|nr:FtsX-like permease family protein [Lachnospiraceae bacterium]
MKRGFYPKLALTGIRKNRQTYVPYLLTCIGMIMMFYIVSALSRNEVLAAMKGGSLMQEMLSLGMGIMGAFSLIFLFYTNSFLIRRRKREFGLYNILGMGKWNLARVLVWECVIMFAISIVCGLLCGILFSKVGELCMTWVLREKVDFSFYISGVSVVQTVVFFLIIFFLILLNSLRQIQAARPIELLHSDKTAEKPPKSNWILALAGVLILGGAYTLAVLIEDPMTALLWFFIAVIMVIVATYLLFIAGSVVFCRLLQKNKKFYYKTNHFISVSSMVYRMKQNGAGLASICILSTMVLVTLSSTVCLFIGTEDSLQKRYPRDIVAETYSLEEKYTDAVHKSIEATLEKAGEKPENMLYYRYLASAAFFKGDEVTLNAEDFDSDSSLGEIFLLPLEDYNRVTGKKETLKDDEVLLYCTKRNWNYDKISISGLGEWNVKKVVEKFVDNGLDSMQMVPSVFIFIPNLDDIPRFVAFDAKGSGMNLMEHDYYAFDLSCSDEKIIEIAKQIRNGKDGIVEIQLNDEKFPSVSTEVLEEQRIEFYGMYGGLFFLGIFLGLVFIFGTVLIMYYKQIIEGYEDRARFDILQKVGMTAKEIRKSINSQILTVFFLPLAIAGIHTGFAFPMVSKILLVLGLTDTNLLIWITVGCYLVFALFYIAVYVATSRVYYGIVTQKEAEA